MSWINEKEAVGIIMPKTPEETALALPGALALARHFKAHSLLVPPGHRPFVEAYLPQAGEVKPTTYIDLSLPPEVAKLPTAGGIGITANPMSQGFQILIKPRSADPLEARRGLLAGMGVPEVEINWVLPRALEKAEMHLERTGYYRGRLRVFFDTGDRKLEEGLRNIYGTEVMIVSGDEADPEKSLMLLWLSDLYMGAGTVFTGFALAFGKKCLLTGETRVPEGSSTRPVGNLKRSLKRMGFL